MMFPGIPLGFYGALGTEGGRGLGRAGEGVATFASQ